ncbi:MAG: hypothetical protein ACYSR9_15900 [Planctomycetota bacterium]|jgi:hypothetical protein
MKKLTIATFAAVLLFTAVNQSYAQNCNSAASVVADIWGKVHEVSYQAGCRIVTEVVTLGNGSAREDSRSGSVTLSNPVDAVSNYSDCFDTVAKLSNLNSKLVTFWNSKVNNSWATIGPRRLTMEDNHTGNLVGTGGRKFVTFPLFDRNSVTITIDETGGKGKTSVTVCKIDADNQKTNIGTKWFNDTKDRKKKRSEKRSFTDTFKYTLRAN